MSKMKAQDVVDAVAKHAGLPKSATKQVLLALADVVEMNLALGHEVPVSGLGKFVVTNTKPAVRRNPLNGEKVDVPAKVRPSFKISASMKASLNSK